MRRLLLFAAGAAALGVIAVVAAVVVWRLRSDDPDLATEAPPIPTASGAPASPVGGTDAPRPSLPPGVRRFVISSSESTVKYVVEETLRGLPATAVGTTSAITGEIYLTPQGLYKDLPSKFMVDLRTLRSDESMRDNFIRQNTLQTGRYPFAEFVVESIDGFPVPYVENTQVSLTLTGTLKIKDVSRQVTFAVLARQQGNTLTATADTDFKMTDFGISPPEVIVARAKDEVHLQVVLVAREA